MKVETCDFIAGSSFLEISIQRYPLLPLYGNGEILVTLPKHPYSLFFVSQPDLFENLDFGGVRMGESRIRYGSWSSGGRKAKPAVPSTIAIDKGELQENL